MKVNMEQLLDLKVNMEQVLETPAAIYDKWGWENIVKKFHRFACC